MRAEGVPCVSDAKVVAVIHFTGPVVCWLSAP